MSRRLFAAAVGVACGLDVLAAQPAPVPDRELARRLDSLVAATPGFSGVAVLGRRGAVLHAAAAGRVRPGGAAPTAETAFNLGSITKHFTATLVRQVAAEQGWSLDTNVAALWPSYPDTAVSRRITVRQLLNHTSGVSGDIFAGDSAARGRLRTLRDFQPLVVGQPLAFPPGTRESYSNAGYVLLGLLLEHRTGMPLDALLATRIYTPAGMTRAGHFARDSLPVFAAVGTTTRNGSAGTPNTATLPGRGSSAGGSYASAADLLRYLEALRARRIAQGGGAGIGVAGGSPGVNAVVEGALPGDIDLVVLVNVDPPLAERVARIVRGWLGASN